MAAWQQFDHFSRKHHLPLGQKVVTMSNMLQNEDFQTDQCQVAIPTRIWAHSFQGADWGVSEDLFPFS